jgi:hypothetical protein
VLNNGRLEYSGLVSNSIGFYIESNRKNNVNSIYQKEVLSNSHFELISATLINSIGETCSEFEMNESIRVVLQFNLSKEIPGLYGYIVIKDLKEEVLIESDTKELGDNSLNNSKVGKNIFHIDIPAFALSTGAYIVYLSFSSAQATQESIDSPGDILKFDVVDNITTRGFNRVAKTGIILNWEMYVG